MWIFDWNTITEHLGLLVNAAYVVTVVFIILLIIIENRSPIKSISWILVVTLIPVLGVLFYIFFGQKYQKKILYSRKVTHFNNKISNLLNTQIKDISKISPTDIHSEIALKKDIMHLLMRNDRAFVSQNHSIKILNNGSETYAQLKDDLAKAKHHIHLEFFIFKFDDIGNEIFEILKERAAAGVEVRLVYDSVGSYYMPRSKKREARKHNIIIKSFNKVLFPFLTSKINYRNHRKIVVIDGVIGFSGGLNISDKYNEKKSGQTYWRDTFVRIEGLAVTALQMIFINDWYYVSKQNIFHEKYFVEDKTVKGNFVQIISGGPDSDWKSVLQFYFSAITSSREHVYLVSPYFIPNDELSFALKSAAMRGIDVRLLIPEKSDTRISHWSSMSYVKEMLKAGVKIYMYQKGFCHSKLLISDGVMCSIGSANLDYRSLETQFEVSAIIYDKKITNQLSKKFFEDVSHSKLLTLQSWQKRKWHAKFISSFARLFAPLM